MNRIILVGNGFDLAHNLHTSYKDFMNWYWDNCLCELRKCNSDTYSDGLCKFILKNKPDSWHSFLWHYIPISSKPNGKEVIDKMLERKELFVIEPCLFLKKICTSIKDRNWVDIENEYYQCLLKSDEQTTKELNKSFEYIQNKLVEYLRTIDYPNIIDEVHALIQTPIRKSDVSISGLNYWNDFMKERCKYSEDKWNQLFSDYEIKTDINLGYNYKDLVGRWGFPNKSYYDLSEIDKMSEPELYYHTLIPNRTLLLNFNYTTVADQYLPNAERFSTIHIHGELSDPNSIIFGYGDEKDKDYNNIIDKNDNEYLRHMKQPHYSESDNYRRMLAFVESAPYQVYIMGHSCGNSDRTLLNTLFEHPNCVSIKPFYYVDKESGKDNYLDIVQNISRNFTDAKKMRDRVVNKTYCHRMPQIASIEGANNE